MERPTRFPFSFPSFAPPPIIAGLGAHIRRLPPGDKFIAALLFLVFILACLAGLVFLERTYLVKVPAEGGELTEGVLGNPRFVNPLLALSDADRDLTALTYAGLMGIGASGELVPVLAERYEISEDGKTYTFTLRAGAKFSDGSSVTADDVVFTVEKAQNPRLKSPEYANWANVRAEALDARTVRFTLPQAYAPFIEDTTLGILPSRLWRNIPNDQFPFSPLMEKPVGAGPFKVVGVVRDSDGFIREYRLAAFADYAPGRPYLDRITIKFYGSGSDLVQALRAGRIESAYGIADDRALRAPYARVFGVFFNETAEPVLANLEVRKALSLAIDRTRIVNEVLGGYGTPLTGPLPPTPDDAVLATADMPELPDAEARIAAARSALDDAGWDYEEEVGWVKGESVMPIITIRTSTVPELKTIASLVQADWEALGIPVEVELYEAGDLAQQVIRPRAYDALLFGEVVGRGRDLYAFWHSSQKEDPGLNIALFGDSSTDVLLTRARGESDFEESYRLVAEAASRIAARYPAAFTHAPDFLYAVPKDLEGIVLPQITSPSDRFATVAAWHRHSEYLWPFLVSSK
ncbi:MAG TPA: ABC transporter substrate-binding protein [Candidatus Paceibacterota bacterium]|nr:ABC transporter substrate-binding protein [Candidatus Paceibacterota bacterium]